MAKPHGDRKCIRVVLLWNVGFLRFVGGCTAEASSIGNGKRRQCVFANGAMAGFDPKAGRRRFKTAWGSTSESAVKPLWLMRSNVS